MMVVRIDQMGRKTEMNNRPRRIVSLVPSQTELLYDLGLGDRVVGITKFCIHPKVWFEQKTRIGGTKTVNLDKVRELQPDLIIANKEENTKLDIERLSAIAPVWISDIYSLVDACEMIKLVGEITDSVDKANQIAERINEGFSEFQSEFEGKTVLYLIWKDPYMAVGENTFIHSLLTNQLHLVNVISPRERYPEIDLTRIAQAPDYVFLSSEPYPFTDKHKEEIQQLFPNSKIVLVDGEYFSWYGSRLMGAPDYLNQLQQILKSE
jgi:iron complex transport system substrate-binding protein